MVNPCRFYTYAYLREDRTPYYIGKGTGERLYLNCNRGCNKPKDQSRIIFLKQNLTEEEAFKHEIYMISVFGRKDLGTGILRNKTNGGEGSSGLVHSEESKRRQSLTKKGRKVWNDGCGNMKMSYECPGTGWVLGVCEESKNKNRLSNKNRKWWIDGNGNMKRSVECPGEGWVLGMSEEHKKNNSLAKKGKNNHSYGKKWWNDGCGNMKFAVECPGEGWVLGKSEESKKKQSLSIKNKIKKKMNDKSKIFFDIWKCAYQRRGIYKGTDREHREHETVRMCLDMKDVKFYRFDSEKPRYV